MITIDVDIGGALGFFTEVQETQLPFATALALNNTAKDFQTAQRAHMHDIFTVRREPWVDRSVKITHFATKAEPWAQIAIQPPGSDGAARADILTKFEDDTEKVPPAGRLGVSIPVAARTTRAGVVRDSQRPRAFAPYVQVPSRSGLTIFKGQQGVVIYQKPDGSGAIIQYANGPHRHGQQDGTLLYLLRPSVHIRPELHFQDIAERTVDDRFAERFDEAFARAMATAR